MSTPTGDDSLLVSRGGINYRQPLANLLAKIGDTDLLAVSRGGVDYRVSGADFKADKLAGTDLIAIGRNGVDYKCTFSDYKQAFGIPPLEIGSIDPLQQTLADPADPQSRYQYKTTVRLKSTGPSPTLPPGISWEYIVCWRRRDYWKFVLPDGVIKYCSAHVQFGFHGLEYWFHGPSDKLYEDKNLGAGRYITFTGPLNYHDAYWTYNMFRTDKPGYWLNKSYTVFLSIPYRWHYWNDGLVPETRPTNKPPPYPAFMVDYRIYNNDVVFPAGTSIQFISELYNDFGARTTASSPVLVPTRIAAPMRPDYL